MSAPTRRTLLGGAALAGIGAALAPAVAQSGVPCNSKAPTPSPDRRAWLAAQASLAREQSRDDEVDARHTAACAAGTLTDDLDKEWSDSAVVLCDAEWAAFETDAPDLQAVAWKIGMLLRRQMIQDDFAQILTADLRRLQPEG